jgi:hypothetical protein
MGDIAVIDGNLLAYVAASAGEKRTVIATHNKSGNEKEFEGKRAFKEFLVEKNAESGEDTFKVTDFTITEKQHAPDVRTTLHVVKEMINGILNACKTDKFEIYLDHEDDTFRSEVVATVQKYKGNRVGKLKPVNLQAAFEYLILHKGAQVVTETHRGYPIEADDKVNMRKWEGYIANKNGVKDRVISVTFDKDDLGNPGWSYDFRKDGDGNPLMKEPVFIDGLGYLNYREKNRDCKGRGRKFLYYQVLDEDTADAYRGRKLSGKRYSAKKAYDDLNPCKTDKECWEVLVRKYKEWYPEPKAYTSWDGKELEATWLSMLQEHWDLARMLRWVGDEVNVVDVLDKLGVEYDN